jgi:polyisoprenoid-binding protein YceI
MKRIALFVVGAGLVAAVGVVVWFFATTGVDEDTAGVTAPTLAPATSPATTLAPGTTAASPTETTGSGGGEGLFSLSAGTVARFELDEVLRGEPKHVVASNTEVAGQIRIVFSDLATSELGTIVIGAQTFSTDSGNRDRAIRGPILDSTVFPEITFVPTSIEGLTGAAEVGQELAFSVKGDLTIRDVTTEVTFEVTAVLVSDGRVEGKATATVLRSAYGLEIPSVPSVADVSDEVLVGINFVATPA